MTAVAAIGTALLAGVLPLAVAIQSGRVVDGATRSFGAGAASPVAAGAIRAALVLAGLYLASQALLAVRTWLGEAAGRRLSGVALARAMAAASASDSVDHLDDPAVAAWVGRTRGIGSIEVLPGDGTSSLVNKLSAWTGNFGATIFLGSLRWWIGIAAGLLFASSYVAIVRGYRDIVVGSRDETGALRRTAYLRDTVLTSAAAKEVRVFGLAGFFLGRFHESWASTREELARVRFQSEWVSFLVSGVVAAAYLAVFGYLGSEAAAGRLAVADIAAAILAIGVLTNGILPGRDDLNISWGATSLAAVRALEALTPGQAAPADRPRVASRGISIECQDLAYAYRNGHGVFTSLTLRLAPGESLAIVGENGAGKTTLARLLAGLSIPTGGAVVVDGQPLTDGTLAQWQRQVAVLFQDFVHYEASLRDNVMFGAPEDGDDTDGFRRVCTQAGLDELIARLPHGADTLLSPHYVGGADLSGGQWQRVALARALFAVDHGARLLILDEPAANLDVAAEVELYDRVLQLASGVTIVIVSHRLAAVRHADRIVVLDGGVVVEDGSHGDLMARGGAYAGMFNLQARRFEAGGGE